MAMAEQGLAGLPEGSIRPELERKRLVRAGGRNWDAPLELRIYRAAERPGPEVEELWALLVEGGQAEA